MCGKRYRVTAWQGGEGRPRPTVMDKAQALSAAKAKHIFKKDNICTFDELLFILILITEHRTENINRCEMNSCN